MKTLTNTLTASIIALSAATSCAFAKDRIVILSNAMPEAEARVVLQQSKRILAAMKPGDSVTFLNGPTGKYIASVDLPDGEEGAAILASRGKMNKTFGDPVKRVQDFIVEGATTAAALPADKPPFQVNLPGALHALTQYAPQEPDVIFFGTLRYQDDRNPQYSMVHSFPNDAHRLFSPTITPFGTQGRDGTLNGTRVHFCDLDQGYYKPMQQLGLERATALAVQGHGAVFANYTQSITDCVDSALDSWVNPAKAVTADETQTEMINYDVTQTGQVPTTTAQEQLDLLDRLDLPQNDADAMLQRIQDNTVQLAEVWIYDTKATDGDVVDIVSGSFRHRVHLTKTRQQVIVPITDGALQMVGVRDGTGGITVGVRTKDDEEIISPVMRVGETINLPFINMM